MTKVSPTPNINEIVQSLKSKGIKTWFDLGLFLDKIQDAPTQTKFDGDFESYRSYINEGAIGMMSFFFTIDGITVEANKYTRVLKNIFPETKVHYIAGEIHEEADTLIETPFRKEIKEMDGFDNWSLYHKFFKEKIERGSPGYNALITEFWDETLRIFEQLGEYIVENDIRLLYIINVCSNPGNVSLALATALISEHLQIPVINNNHDFYWEGGSRKVDIEEHGAPKGPRDFFFTNSDVGEFFSVLEVLFPWNRRSWMTVNINRIQYEHTILNNGHNPNNVEQIGTALDHDVHHNVSKRNMIRAFKQAAFIFANKKDSITVHTAKHHIDSKRSLEPILLGSETIRNFDFVNNNIVFLQPTRVISRKSIELNFKLIAKLFSNQNFLNKFIENPELKISMIVTGPIPHGQQNYYRSLIKDFSNFLETLPDEFKPKIFLGFLFSAFDKDSFKQKYNSPIDINRLYQIASLILLPSQTEGRGLPILEAAASGTPIYCRQYEPREVYDEVIGNHMSEVNRLKVLEFSGSKVSNKLIDQIIDQVFYPQYNVDIVEHNLNVIKHRYSYEALERNMLRIVKRLHRQLQSITDRKDYSEIGSLFKKYSKATNFRNADLEAIMNLETRHYLPGYSRLGFMVHLKSLIDPSFFRVEEQLFRGRILDYATRIHRKFSKDWKRWGAEAQRFYNLVEDVFNYHEGKLEIQHDHSLAYRHRNRLHYKYRDYTHQEIIGLVNMIHQEVFTEVRKKKLTSSPQFFTGWELALHQMTNSESLAIDNRDRLTQYLKKNVPIGYFPGDFIKHEMEYFILQPFRRILNLGIEDELTEELILKNKKQLFNSYIFVKEPAKKSVFFDENIIEYIESGQEDELTLLYKHGLVQVIKTKQWSGGVHFPQMGADALKVMRDIKEKNGIIIANGQRAAMMSDILNIDRFHIGKAKDVLTAKVMGIPHNSGFIQFIPAGVRTTLAYPTPVQNAKGFDKALRSDQFRSLAEKFGEQELFDLMARDAELNGTPIQKFMDDLESQDYEEVKDALTYRFIGGVYADGLPWSGVMSETNTKENKWKFNAHFAQKGPRNVPALLKEAGKVDARLAWNGGYILNNELVGKLGLPETYIGSPLGLLILDGKVKCPPLFNKPAFIIYEDGKIDIQRVNCKNGMKILLRDKEVIFDAKGYNQILDNENCFFDINHDLDHFISKGQTVVRIAGNTIKEIRKTKVNEKIPIIPVGITLCFAKDPDLDVETDLSIELIEQEIKWSEIAYAIEAGPMLLDNGNKILDMEIEGWKTVNSIKTQAARLDYVDMRGPKIAVGIDDNGALKVLAVNGRIRESVGATHIDMADILKEQGMTKAMGFDPGGSSTLYVDGEVKNISPYNSKYEADIYSLPPEPRFVSNIIFGWLD